MSVCIFPAKIFTMIFHSFASQPYFSYVHACAYEKWAGGSPRAEKYVWALSTGFRVPARNVGLTNQIAATRK